MLHRIRAPDWSVRQRSRTVVWDDQESTVTGTHVEVDRIGAALERSDREQPLVVREVFGRLVLTDPHHSAPDFLALLGWHLQVELDLPDSLRAVTPTPWDMVEMKPDYDTSASVRNCWT